VNFARANAAVTRVCFFLVRSTSFELSPVPGAAELLGVCRTTGIFGGNRVKDGAVVNTKHCYQL